MINTRLKITNLLVNSFITNNRLTHFLAKIYLKYLPVYLTGRFYYMPSDRFQILPQILSGQLDNYVFSVMRKYINPGSNIVDIGANIGTYSIFFSDLTGSRGRVFAFEPDSMNLQYLKRNIKLNRVKNITAIRKAVSDRNGKAKLYLSEALTWDHRLFNPPGEKRKYEIVSQVKLDSLLVAKKIDFIKMDVQGYEDKCLEGMQQIINKNKNLLIFTEFWPKGLKDAGTDPLGLINKIKSLGFKIYTVDALKEKIEPLRNINLILSLKNYDYVDLLCIKK